MFDFVKREIYKNVEKVSLEIKRIYLAIRILQSIIKAILVPPIRKIAYSLGIKYSKRYLKTIN